MSIPDRHTGLLLEVLSDLKILVRITTSYGKQKWKSEFVYFQMTILRHQPPLQTRKYCVSYTYFKASRPFEQPCSKPVHKNQIPIYTYQVYRSRNLTIDLISQIVIVCFSYNCIFILHSEDKSYSPDCWAWWIQLSSTKHLSFRVVWKSQLDCLNTQQCTAWIIMRGLPLGIILTITGIFRVGQYPHH